jgi:hypothetical protein
MGKPTIVEPDMKTILDRWRNEIFSNLFCTMPGKINSFDTSTQSATVEIQIKRSIGDNKIVSYPMLIDCPVFFLQGAGAYLEFPVSQGDLCLVAFVDRDIDSWWTTGNVKEPNTTRKHSISDGIAIVGLNTKTKPLDLTGNKVKIKTNNKEFEADSGSEKLNLHNATSDLRKETDKIWDAINEILTQLISLAGATAGPYTLSTGSTVTAAATADKINNATSKSNVAQFLK